MKIIYIIDVQNKKLSFFRCENVKYCIHYCGFVESIVSLNNPPSISYFATFCQFAYLVDWLVGGLVGGRVLKPRIAFLERALVAENNALMNRPYIFDHGIQ